MNTPWLTRPSSARLRTAQKLKKGLEENQAGRRSCGGLITQIQTIMVAARGIPAGFHLTPGQARDLESADGLLQAIQGAVIADGAARDILGASHLAAAVVWLDR